MLHDGRRPAGERRSPGDGLRAPEASRTGRSHGTYGWRDSAELAQLDTFKAFCRAAVVEWSVHSSPAMSLKISLAALLSLSAALLAPSIGCSAEVNDGGFGGGDDDGGGGEGAGSNPACAPFLNQESEGMVTFRVVNQTGQDVYVPAFCDAVAYGVQPEAGPDGAYYGDGGGSCNQSCEQLQSEDQYVCDGGQCPPSSIRVVAGETREFVWSGRGREDVEMRSECWFSEFGGPTCSQIVAAPPGSYRVTVGGFSECGADCTCNAEGLCTGQATGLEAVTEHPIFALPASGPVEIVFEVCAFGCPG